MGNGMRGLMLSALSLFLIATGCAAVVVSGTAVGSASGTYVWVNGEMKTDYYFPFDTVWAAVEKTVADMKAVDVLPEKEIAQGKITASINDEKVTFSLKYKSKDQTTVSVRVGVLGNKLSSQLLHDKIADNLRKK
ncbi:MAG: DUF3568 domain-containing protein [Syntrophobacterales bacterium]|nr:DUF3568 domain-containing protein [Syntrophobacterales bacterium]